MLNISNYQRKTQPHGLSSYTIRMATIKQTNKQKITALVRLWRNRNPCALLVVMYSSPATVETVWSFLKKLKIKLPYDPAIPFLGIYQKNWNQGLRCLYTNICSRNILQSWRGRILFGIDEWINKIWYMQAKYFSVSKKERNIFICYKMDESWGHYIGEIICYKKASTTWFHLYEVSKVVKFIEEESKMMVARS